MKTALRCLIVDDEADARSYLRKRLQPHPELAVVGEAGSVREAHALCLALRPDVVFLDVRMPLANGFELIPLLDPAPQIVFVTAYADRAVDAFQVRALDYLLKPYSAERMAETVDKLFGRGMRGQIAPPPAALKPQGSMVVRTGTALLRLNLADIILIEADEPYSRVWVAGDTPHLVTMAMNGWGAAEPAWWLNLQAQPDVTAELPGESRPVHGRAATADERPRLWAKWAEYNGEDKMASYASRRPRETVVVILEPRRETRR